MCLEITENADLIQYRLQKKVAFVYFPASAKAREWVGVRDGVSVSGLYRVEANSKLDKRTEAIEATLSAVLVIRLADNSCLIWSCIFIINISTQLLPSGGSIFS
jgi:hypothetical protein